MFPIRRLFPRRSIVELRAPAHVKVRGLIASSSSTVESPITGRRAIVLGWFLSRMYLVDDKGRRGPFADREVYSILVGGAFAGPWVLVECEGGTVRVSTEALRCDIAAGDWKGESAPMRMPAAYGELGVATSDPMIHYGERWFSTGDSVILRAEAQPVGEQVGGYRAAPSNAPTADYEVVGRARLTDTIGAQLKVRTARLGTPADGG